MLGVCNAEFAQGENVLAPQSAPGTWAHIHELLYELQEM